MISETFASANDLLYVWVLVISLHLQEMMTQPTLKVEHNSLCYCFKWYGQLYHQIKHLTSIISNGNTSIETDWGQEKQLRLPTIHPSFTQVVYVVKSLEEDSRKTSNVVKGVNCIQIEIIIVICFSLSIFSIIPQK